MRILALNAGSSSIKFALFEGADRLCSGQLRGLDGPPRAQAGDIDTGWEADEPPALTLRLLEWVEHHAGTLDAVGHRVVHGGTEFCRPVRVDGPTLDRIAALTPLAPPHQPASVALTPGLSAASASTDCRTKRSRTG